MSFNAANIQQSGNTNITSFLQRVPALTNSLDSTRTAGNAQGDGAIGQAGLNLLDLRGLGTNRTLVLVNGRRHVASQFDTAAVDINAIPTDLIERVDVLTGAASAVYGADGVSGVVNFILRRNLDGIAARSQFGISSRGDAANRFASIIAGGNFADGRGNITLAHEYNAEQPLGNDDRASLRSANRVFFVNNKNYVPGQAGSYVKIPTADNRYTGSYFDADGVQQPGGSYANIIKIGNQFFRGDGRPYTFGTQMQTDDYSTGGDDSPVAGYIGDIAPRTRGHAANLFAHFDASEAFKISLEGKFVQASARTLSSYSGTYGVAIPLDNPFVPPSILAAARANGDTAVYINRNNFDLPRRGEQDRRRIYRGVVDVAGKISDHASYDAYYTFGRTDIAATKLNDRLPDRYSDALDAVRNAAGQIVCRSAVARAAGCVPLNTFGTYVADPASFGYFLDDPLSRARVQQQVANATLNGDFGQFFKRPGPVRRGRRISARVQQLQPRRRARQRRLLFAGAGHLRRAGAADAQQRPLRRHGGIRRIERAAPEGAAVRLPALGGRRGPLFRLFHDRQHQGLSVQRRLRADRGCQLPRFLRAGGTGPNISELFRPRTGFSDFVTDPCYLGNRTQGTQYRAANCVALIRAAGGNPNTFTAANNPDANLDIPGFQQGNPNLRAEAARTWTAGVVLRPRFLPRLQIAVDWYDIRLKDAINLATATDLANLCVDLPTTANAFCQTISRRQGTGYVNAYAVQPENVAAFRTSGLEFNANYQLRTSRLGQFDLRLVGSYLHRLTQLPLPGAVLVDNADQPFRPKYSLVFSPTWTFRRVTLSYTLRWQDGVRRFARIDTDSNAAFVDPRYFRFKDLWQHDLQAQVHVDERFDIYSGVNNLADQKPDIGFETNVPISPVGRYFYLGAKVRLAR